mgnify:CR=1 FL=1
MFGHDIERDEMAVKQLINRVSVDAAFFKKLSPMENLLFAARLYGLDAGRARREAIEILGRPELNNEAFREINVRGNRLDTPEKIEAFFTSRGVSKADFQKAFSGFADGQGFHGQPPKGQNVTQL